MTYGAEAVIPLETGFPTLRTSAFTSNGNDELLKKSLDLIEEQRENAIDRKSTRLNSSHLARSRMPSSA